MCHQSHVQRERKAVVSSHKNTSKFRYRTEDPSRGGSDEYGCGAPKALSECTSRTRVGETLLLNLDFCNGMYLCCRSVLIPLCEYFAVLSVKRSSLFPQLSGRIAAFFVNINNYYRGYSSATCVRMRRLWRRITCASFRRVASTPRSACASSSRRNRAVRSSSSARIREPSTSARLANLLVE
jgi:hypothetical protein